MIFFIVFSLVLLSVYSYVGYKLIISTKIKFNIQVLLIGILLTFYLLPISTLLFQFNKIENDFTTIIAWIGYTGLGAVSLLFFMLICIDCFYLLKTTITTTHKFDPQRKEFITLGTKALVGIMGGIGTIWGLYSALKTPKIIQVKIPIQNIPDSIKKIRLAQITDLHVSKMITDKYVQRVTNQLQILNPDILFFTGDAADGSVKSYGKYMKSLGDIKPKYGKYFVTGNHEYYSDLNGWLRLIEKLGFKILVNESQIININGYKIMITGIPDRSGKYFSNFHKTDMNKALEGMPKPDLKILLAHRPKDIEYSLKYNYDIQLSGHTHGGQYFPFSILVQLAHPFIKGLHKRENTWVYINQGTGYWGPPMRIGTEPEITEISLIS